MRVACKPLFGSTDLTCAGESDLDMARYNRNHESPFQMLLAHGVTHRKEDFRIFALLHRRIVNLQ